MNILVDVSPTYNTPLTGIGFFTQGLVESLSELRPNMLQGYAFNYRRRHISNLPINVIEQTHLPGKFMTYPRHLGIELPLDIFFNTRGFDFLLGTNYLLPPTLRRMPSVPFIHDLCFLDHPEWVQRSNARILKDMLPNTIKRSAGVITISNFSLSRIRHIYGYTGPALVVGIPPKLEDVSATKPANLRASQNSYFLSVGTVEPRKNLSTALDAYEALPGEIKSKYPLIIAGKPGWDSTVLNRLNSIDNKNIIYLSYVSEQEKKWLYKNALATIMPSHYEGFGMTILESLINKTPVITSDIPPHNEILGKSSLSFNPEDKNSLTNLLNTFTDLGFRQKAITEQYPVVDNYSWGSVSTSILRFLESLE